MFSLITSGLKMLGQTRFGKKIQAKASGAIGNLIAKIGKKSRAGKQNKTDSVPQLAYDRDNFDGGKSSYIVPPESEHPVSDTLGDFLKRTKDKAGPIEVQGAVKNNTFLYLFGGLALLGVAYAVTRN